MGPRGGACGAQSTQRTSNDAATAPASRTVVDTSSTASLPPAIVFAADEARASTSHSTPEMSDDSDEDLPGTIHQRQVITQADVSDDDLL